MSIKLMYITNNPGVARVVEAAGVDRVFVDLEYIGKSLRQGGMDTVQSRHTLQDVKSISEVLTTAELLVRVNPIHEETEEYCSSKEEIETAINNGAEIIMLPYFKTVKEVEDFVIYVDGRCKTMLLFETPESVQNIDQILDVEGIDEVFVGLNDLSLGYKKKFMFELLADGTVDYLIGKFASKNYQYGFGGLASLDKGLLPGEKVLKEHYRLASSSVILSRSFCNASKIEDIRKIETVFQEGISNIRKCEKECEKMVDFSANREEVRCIVERIIREL